MRWKRFGARLSLAGLAATGRVTASPARAAGLSGGRLTRQSFSSTSGRCGDAVGAGVGIAGGAVAATGGATGAYSRAYSMGASATGAAYTT